MERITNTSTGKHRSKNPQRPHYVGHRERLRKRFQNAGAEGFHDYELLELLLTYAIPRKDVKPVAKELMKRFGSFSGVLNANLEELERTPGLGSASAILLRLIRELFGAYLAETMKKKDLLTSPQAAVDFARVKLSGYPHEVFMTIYLNTKNEVIDYQIVHEGTVNRTIVYPRRIVESALAHQAAGLLFVHNHPTGHTEPSEEDKHITRTIVEATRTIDIRILDHIIVGKEGYFSFAENDLIACR